MIEYSEFTTAYGDKINIPLESVVEHIKGIYQDRVYAEYVAGTLCIYMHGYCILLNLQKGLPEIIEFWLSKLYIKHKHAGCHYWEYAKKVIKAHNG